MRFFSVALCVGIFASVSLGAHVDEQASIVADDQKAEPKLPTASRMVRTKEEVDEVATTVAPHSSGGSADEDLAMILAQPCTPDAAIDAAAEHGSEVLFGENASLGCGTANNSSVSIFGNRMKPASEMTPEEKKTAAARQKKVLAEMEKVANKSMKAMMAQQIAQKTACIAKQKADQLARLRTRQKDPEVTTACKRVADLEKAVECEREAILGKTSETAKTLEKLECLRKGAMKAEKKVKDERETRIKRIAMDEKEVECARKEVEDCADRQEEASKTVREEIRELSKECWKARSAALKSELQAEAAEKEVELAKENSPESLGSDDALPCSSPDVVDVIDDTIQNLTNGEVAAITEDPTTTASACAGPLGGDASIQGKTTALGASSGRMSAPTEKVEGLKAPGADSAKESEEDPAKTPDSSTGGLQGAEEGMLHSDTEDKSTLHPDTEDKDTEDKSISLDD